jgi:hypothetical protein
MIARDERMPSVNGSAGVTVVAVWPRAGGTGAWPCVQVPGG